MVWRLTWCLATKFFRADTKRECQPGLARSYWTVDTITVTYWSWLFSQNETCNESLAPAADRSRSMRINLFWSKPTSEIRLFRIVYDVELTVVCSKNVIAKHWVEGYFLPMSNLHVTNVHMYSHWEYYTSNQCASIDFSMVLIEYVHSTHIAYVYLLNRSTFM